LALANPSLPSPRQSRWIAAEEPDGWLFVDSGRDQEIIIVETAKTGAVVVAPVAEGVIEAIEDNEIDVVIIDSFVLATEL
jgi:hypothetical protein